jgi:plastocyanin
MTGRLLALAALALSAAALAGPSAAATPTLNGSVSGNSAFVIKLTLGGKPVKSLKAGKYIVLVKDPATIHNFRLKGPGVNKATSVAGKSTARWVVTLRKGRYTYQCDPHAATGMKGTFVVK